MNLSKTIAKDHFKSLEGNGVQISPVISYL